MQLQYSMSLISSLGAWSPRSWTFFTSFLFCVFYWYTINFQIDNQKILDIQTMQWPTCHFSQEIWIKKLILIFLWEINAVPCYCSREASSEQEPQLTRGSFWDRQALAFSRNRDHSFVFFAIAFSRNREHYFCIFFHRLFHKQITFFFYSPPTDQSLEFFLYPRQPCWDFIVLRQTKIRPKLFLAIFDKTYIITPNFAVIRR